MWTRGLAAVIVYLVYKLVGISGLLDVLGTCYARAEAGFTWRRERAEGFTSGWSEYHDAVAT